MVCVSIVKNNQDILLTTNKIKTYGKYEKYFCDKIDYRKKKNQNPFILRSLGTFIVCMFYETNNLKTAHSSPRILRCIPINVDISTFIGGVFFNAHILLTLKSFNFYHVFSPDFITFSKFSAACCCMFCVIWLYLSKVI